VAVHDDPEHGPAVLHFAIPFDAPGLAVQDTWRTLGMRGTGSHHIVLDGVFVRDAAVGVRRAPHRWEPWHVVAMHVEPLIFSVHVGIAEAARALALRQAARRRHEAGTQELVGRMENELATARMALRHMTDAAAGGRPGIDTTNEVMIGRTVAGRAAIRTVEAVMEVASGAGFYRDRPLAPGDPRHRPGRPRRHRHRCERAGRRHRVAHPGPAHHGADDGHGPGGRHRTSTEVGSAMGKKIGELAARSVPRATR
jgi:alkylation response protein AidB-like acyl-CoA dehydrogenase